MGIAVRCAAVPYFPKWDHRRWFNTPVEWFRKSHGDTFQNAEQWGGLEHIDPRARVYLQDAGLFANVADRVREVFAPSPVAAQYLARPQFQAWREACQRGAVAVHVRRGDLLTQTPGFQPALTVDAPDYYRDAATLCPDAELWVFSDDPAWCTENMPALVGRPVTVMAGNPDWVDLQLMASADHHIMSNSTYSWWTVFLSGNRAPISPSLWWGPNLEYVDTGLMVPGGPDWVTVPC